MRSSELLVRKVKAGGVAGRAASAIKEDQI